MSYMELLTEKSIVNKCVHLCYKNNSPFYQQNKTGLSYS